MSKHLNRLKELRQKEGMSLKQLSKTLKEEYNVSVSTSQLMYYEKGEREPRNKEIWEKLAKLFKVPLSYLLAYDQVIDNMEKELPTLQKATNIQYENYYNLYKQSDKNVDELVKTLIKQLDPDTYSVDTLLNTTQQLIDQVTILQETVKILLKLKDKQHEGELLKNKIENLKDNI